MTGAVEMQFSHTLNKSLIVPGNNTEKPNPANSASHSETQKPWLNSNQEHSTTNGHLVGNHSSKEEPFSCNAGDKSERTHNNHNTIGLLHDKSWTPYDKLVTALNCDQNIKWELAYGKRIGFYSLKGEIGTGNFSKVKIGMHSLTKERVAIKILDKMKMDETTKRLLSREISSMEKLHHPNIVRLYEVMHTRTKLYLVMEYACGGELFNRLSSQGKMPESDARNIFSQILSAVEHMHEHNIIHRDLKAENVFYSEKKKIKVGDFGFSTKAHGSSDALDTFCGSPPYAAPELFRDSFYYGEYVDIWALGILLYFTVTGTMPFRAETVGKLKKKILLGHFTVPSHISLNCKHLIHNILKLQPAQRFSLKDIRQSSWLSGTLFPRATSFFKLYPSQVEKSRAQPEEAYALYMLDRLGVNENHIRQTLTADVSNQESLFSWNCESKTVVQNSESELHTRLYIGNAIVGTYRILLLRAHKKMLQSSKEEVLKMSAITKHITGTDVPIKSSIIPCDRCSKTVESAQGEDAKVSDEDTNRIARNDGDALASSRPFSDPLEGNLPKQNRRLPIKSKFCALL